jgi:hypothetical protein
VYVSELASAKRELIGHDRAGFTVACDSPICVLVVQIGSVFVSTSFLF